MSQIWIVEADSLEMDDININLVHKTERIKKFLEQDSYSLITSTKGWGKTFLLKVKRKMLQDKGIICIPYDKMIDTGRIYINGNDKITFLKKRKIWVRIWSISIIMSIFKSLLNHSKISVKINDKLLADYIQLDLYTPFDFLGYFLCLELKEIDDLFSIYIKYMLPAYKKIDAPIAVFIDSVDEAFREYLYNYSNVLELNDHELSTNTPEVWYAQELWYYSQLGLMDAAFFLHKDNPRITVYASIRKETIIKDESEMMQQIHNNIIDLVYSFNDLKNMFFRYVKEEKDENLFQYQYKMSDPCLAFFGTDKISNKYRVEKKEDIFEYIYRHTLKRPRDIIEICKELSENKEERTEEFLKGIINKKSTDIAKQYIKESKVFLNNVDLPKIFSLIDTNILSHNKIKQLCLEYNRTRNKIDFNKCNDCRDCKLEHPFCSLYNIGLLGVIKADYDNIEKQSFLSPGEALFSSKKIIKDSKYYFIHPCLNALIKKNYNINYRTDKDIIVGDNQLWITEKVINISNPPKKADNKNNDSGGNGVVINVDRSKKTTIILPNNIVEHRLMQIIEEHAKDLNDKHDLTNTLNLIKNGTNKEKHSAFIKFKKFLLTHANAIGDNLLASGATYGLNELVKHLQHLIKL